LFLLGLKAGHFVRRYAVNVDNKSGLDPPLKKNPLFLLGLKAGHFVRRYAG